LFEKVVDEIEPSKIVYEGAKIPASALSIEDVVKRLKTQRQSEFFFESLQRGRNYYFFIVFFKKKQKTLSSRDCKCYAWTSLCFSDWMG
jgi:hypothetical protein